MASQTACKFPSGFSFEKGWRPPSFWNSKNQNGHKNPHTEPVKFVIMRFLRKWLTVKLEVCWSEGLIQSKSQGRVLLHKIHTHTQILTWYFGIRDPPPSQSLLMFFSFYVKFWRLVMQKKGRGIQLAQRKPHFLPQAWTWKITSNERIRKYWRDRWLSRWWFQTFFIFTPI